jgi:hypothetical protein
LFAIGTGVVGIAANQAGAHCRVFMNRAGLAASVIRITQVTPLFNTLPCTPGRT